jgi:phospholipase C
VASWVCIAFLVVTLYVCLAFGWITVKIFCPILWFVLSSICWGWNIIWCGLPGIGKATAGLFGSDPGIARIDHIFVLMLGNRSFNHMLGYSGLTCVDPQGNPTVFNEGFSTSLSNLQTGLFQLWIVINVPDCVEAPPYVAVMDWSPSVSDAGITTLN